MPDKDLVAHGTLHHGKWVESKTSAIFPIQIRCPGRLTVDEARQLADELDDAVLRVTHDASVLKRRDPKR